MLNQAEKYHRKKQILYDEDGKPILQFLDKMPDRIGLTGDLIANINNYIKCYPERVEIKNNVQLNLF